MTPLCQYIWDFHVSLLYLHTYIYTIFSSWFLRSLYTGRNICNLLAFFVLTLPFVVTLTQPSGGLFSSVFISVKWSSNSVKMQTNPYYCERCIVWLAHPTSKPKCILWCVQERDPEYWWWLQQENLLNRSAGCIYVFCHILDPPNIGHLPLGSCTLVYYTTSE